MDQRVTRRPSPTRTAPRPAPRRASRRRRVGRWLARASLALVFLLATLLTLTPTGRATVRAALLLPALLGGVEPAPLALLGERTRHTTATVPSRGGDVSLDIYAPLGSPAPVPGAREGLLLIPGVGDNRSDPQLVNLSRSLAASGVVVMDMTTPTLLAYALTPLDGDAVVQGVEALARFPGVGAHRIGIVGFSAGGALASLAAADTRIRDRLAFITLFGGYYDAVSLLRDLGRRALVVNGALTPWQPQPGEAYPVPLTVLANTVAAALPDGEGALLAEPFNYGGAPLTPAELAQLSPPALAAFHLLMGDQPDAVDANLAALSPPMRALLTALSPSAVVAQIHAPIYLLHDRSDAYVPFTESRAFDAALTRLNHPHDFAELGAFDHVEVRSGLPLGPLLADGARLFRILLALLAPAS